jgi:hypothetical protein
MNHRLANVVASSPPTLRWQRKRSLRWLQLEVLHELLELEAKELRSFESDSGKASGIVITMVQVALLCFAFIAFPSETHWHT